MLAEITAVPRPYTVVFGDGSTGAAVYPVRSAHKLPADLLAFLCAEFNEEIDRGLTLPFTDHLSPTEFANYWFGGSLVGLMLFGSAPNEPALVSPPGNRDWTKEYFGMFCIRPWAGGRSARVATGDFLVNPGLRGKGVGNSLACCFVDWAQDLGYASAVFNFVFEPNVAARRMLKTVGFEQVGKIPGAAGQLANRRAPSASLIFFRHLGSVIATDSLAHEHPDEEGDDEEQWDFTRFSRIRTYLETGMYPENADRHLKARIRTAAAAYRVEHGRLHFRGRRVIESDSEQRALAAELHAPSHLGVNRLTTEIKKNYHWSRIKATAMIVVRECAVCCPDGQSRKRRRFVSGSETPALSGESNLGTPVETAFDTLRDNSQEAHNASIATPDDTGSIEKVDSSLQQLTHSKDNLTVRTAGRSETADAGHSQTSSRTETPDEP